MIAFLIGLLPIRWPEPLRKAAAWGFVIVAASGLLWAAKALYDASVIEDHENEKTAQSAKARDAAAEERAADIIKNTIEQKEAEDAINSVPADDAQRALDCLRLERINIFPTACGHSGGDGSQAGSD